MKKNMLILFMIPLVLAIHHEVTSAVFLHNRLTGQTAYFRTSKMQDSTPHENLFKIKNSSQNFILLDSFDEDCFVMTEEFLGGMMQFDQNNDQRFDPDNTSNIAYKINQSSWKNTYLPSVLIPYIDTQHVWETEPGCALGNAPEQYSFAGGLSLMSRDEYIAYRDKFGINGAGYVPTTRFSWWLRTGMYEENVKQHILAVNIENKGVLQSWKSSGWALTRPVFYLEEDFFTNVALDLDHIGENVRAYLLSNFSKEELEEIYTSAELESIGFDAILGGPQVTGAELVLQQGDGIAANSTLYVEYDYTYQYPEKDTLCAWYRSNGNETELIKISPDRFYTLGYEDMGFYISCRIFPKSHNSQAGADITISCTTAVETEIRSSYKNSLPPEGMMIDTPPENVFSLPNQTARFIMLDDFDNPYADLYIMCKDFYGWEVYDAQGKQGFYPQDPDNLAYTLNYSFFENGNLTQVLPQEIQWYINRDKVWFTEGGNSAGDSPNQTLTKLGVGILSAFEYFKYTGKFGVRDLATNRFFTWWLRSGISVKNLQNQMLVVNYMDSPGTLQTWGSTGTCLLRPTFYLDYDFFSREKINVYSAGVNVLRAIAERCTDSQLRAAGYTEDEIDIIYLQNPNTQILFEHDNMIFSPDSVGFDVQLDGNGDESYEIDYSVVDRLTGEKDTTAIDHTAGWIPINGLKNGNYQLTVHLRKNHEIISYLRKDFSVIPHYIAREVQSDFINGFNVHYETETEKNEKKTELMQYAKSNWTRTPFYWSQVEKTKGYFDFTAADQIVDDIRNSKLNFFAILIHTSPRLSGGRTVITTDEDINDYVMYAMAVALQYPHITHFQISNEPNISASIASPEVYGKMLARAADALHSINPNIVVVAGSITNVDGCHEYLKTSLAQEDAYKKIDAVSFHPYISGDIDNHYEPTLKQFLQDSMEYGGWKQNIISETGWSTSKVSEEEQASNIIKQFAYSGTCGVFDNLIYNFRDVGENKTYGEHNFGVLNYDFSPKPAYIAYNFYNNLITEYLGRIDAGNQEILSELCQNGALAEGEDYSDVEMHLFSNGGQPLLMLWKKGESASYRIEGDWFDMYGNAVTNQEIANHPVYITDLQSSNMFCKAVLHSQKQAFAKKWAAVLATSEDELRQYLETDSIEEQFNLAGEWIGKFRINTIVLSKNQLYQMLYDYYALCVQQAKISVDGTEDVEIKLPKANSDYDLILDYQKKLIKTGQNQEGLRYRVLANGLGVWLDMLEQPVFSIAARSGKEPMPGDTLMASYTFGESGIEDDLLYGWYVSDREDGEFSPIQGANTLEHIVTYEQSGKYIKFGAQIEDIDGDNQFLLFSNAVKIPNMTLGNLGSPIYESMADSGFRQNSDEDYIFYVGNDKFILLDTFDNDKSTFYVVSYRNYEGDKVFSTTTNKFDPSDIDSLAYYLNHANLLPTVVKNYINNDHIWITEPMYQSTEPYLTKAGVTVPAVWEMEKYKDILGYKDGVISWGVWTRSPWSNPAIANEAIHFNYNSTGIIRCYPVLSKTGAAARPQFMLNRQFFIERVIDHTTMGAKVKEAIFNTYTKDELYQYSEEALWDFGYRPKYTLESTFNGDFTSAMTAGLKVTSSYASQDVAAQVYAATYNIDNKLLGIVKNEAWQMKFTEDVEQTKAYVLTELPPKTKALKIFLWNEKLAPLCENAVLRSK